jgi:hypothetical protein
LFGNNTNLAATLFVQNGSSMVVSGNWFTPGTASFFWDDTISLGTQAIDGDGSFNATVQVPSSTAGQHRLTVNEGNSSFCVNVTRLPTVVNDYSNVWHTANFSINLTHDYAVNETFYRINGGQTLNVTSNEEPTITTESSNNTLEYWSTWNLYGAGTADLPHVTLSGIKLDKTPPTGSISPSSNVVSSPTITLNLDANDDVSGVAQMRFANQNSGWSSWEAYATSKTWTLVGGEGTKTVTVQYSDNAGLTANYSCTVTLQATVASPSATVVPTMTAAIVAPTASPAPTNSPTTQPSSTPKVPELNLQMILILLAASTLMLPLIFKKKRK